VVQYVRSWALEVMENTVCMSVSYLVTWPLHVIACRMDTEGALPNPPRFSLETASPAINQS
jgi:hypothetical protein